MVIVVVYGGMDTAPGLAILIVDDDPRLRELAEAAAQRCGQFREIVVAADAAAALRALSASRESPDIVLTDLAMPGMNGLALVEQIRANPRWQHLPVVMFSSCEGAHNREQALMVGCNRFFEKPVSFHGLQELISELPGIARSMWTHA